MTAQHGKYRFGDKVPVLLAELVVVTEESRERDIGGVFTRQNAAEGIDGVLELRGVNCHGEGPVFRVRFCRLR